MNRYILALMLLLPAFNSAVAATLVFDGNLLTRINGITVQGSEYDAVLNYDTSFNNLWMHDNPDWLFAYIDLNTQQSVFAEVSAVMTDAGLTPENLGGGSSIWAPVEYSRQQNYAQYPAYVRMQSLASWANPGWVTVGVVGISSNATQIYATFEPTAVPLPAAAWLLGSGLVALTVIGRERRATA